MFNPRHSEGLIPIPQIINCYIDYGLSSGFGHLSRCRGILESISKQQDFRVFLYVEKAAKLPKWIIDLNGIQFRELEHFHIPNSPLMPPGPWIIDSYNKEKVQLLLDSLHENTKFLIIRDGYQGFDFDLENSKAIHLESTDKTTSENPYDDLLEPPKTIHKLLIWNSMLEKAAKYCSSVRTIESSHSNRTITISFGGTLPPDHFLDSIAQVLRNLISHSNRLRFAWFVPIDAVKEIKNLFDDTKYVKIFPISDEFYSVLSKTDLLICASGTTLIESIILGIPTISFVLYDNQKANFERFAGQTSNVRMFRLQEMDPLRITNETKALLSAGRGPGYPIDSRFVLNEKDILSIVKWLIR